MYFEFQQWQKSNMNNMTIFRKNKTKKRKGEKKKKKNLSDFQYLRGHRYDRLLIILVFNEVYMIQYYP